MFKTLTINELEVGMFVTNVILKDSPNKVKNQGRVNSQHTINSLKKQGVIKVVIRCEPETDSPTSMESIDTLEKDSDTKNDLSIDETDSKVITNGCSLNDEFSRSCEIYDNTTNNFQVLLRQAQGQKSLSPEAVNLLASEITDSVIRNEYAITILTRIRHHSTYHWEHSTNCAILVCGFALFLGLNRDTALQMTLGGLLHDIGVAKMPKGIIEKPSKLNNNEMELVKKHIAWGQEICKRDGFTTPIILDMLINHHERLDGSGYPRGLKKEKLSKLARIMAIIDVYDAMTGDKLHAKGQQPINVLRYLLGQKEKFDQGVVQQFIKFLGVHPVGSLVQLSNDKLAIVVEGNRKEPLKPKVKIFFSLKLQHYVKTKDCDLVSDPASIIASVRAEDHNINSAKLIRDIIS